MTPFFSIIIPVYNVAPYLRECLDSVLAQTFTDWEAICVDDGSTDGSGAILDEYASGDKRFTVIHKINEGVSVARNTALDITAGEWLTFIDADDWVRFDYLEKLIAVTKKYNSGIAISCVRRYDENGTANVVGPKEDGLWQPEELYVRYNSLCAWAWGKIYKRILWGDIRFPVGIAYSEDRYILHEILFRYPNVPVIAEGLYNYRNRSDSAYGAEWTPKRLQRRFAFERQIAFFSHNRFVKAQLFTAGLYLSWIGMDLIRLANVSSNKCEPYVVIRDEFKNVFQTYWSDFVRIRRCSDWRSLQSCYTLRCLAEQVLSPSGGVSMIKRIAFKLKYDGLVSIGKFFLQRVID